MSSPRLSRAVRWLLPAALFALAPKCLLCVLAYAGLGAALGLGGREMCGAPADVPEVWMSWLLLPGCVLGVTGLVAFGRPIWWRRMLKLHRRAKPHGG